MWTSDGIAEFDLQFEQEEAERIYWREKHQLDWEQLELARVLNQRCNVHEAALNWCVQSIEAHGYSALVTGTIGQAVIVRVFSRERKLVRSSAQGFLLFDFAITVGDFDLGLAEELTIYSPSCAPLERVTVDPESGNYDCSALGEWLSANRRRRIA